MQNNKAKVKKYFYVLNCNFYLLFLILFAGRPVVTYLTTCDRLNTVVQSYVQQLLKGIIEPMLLFVINELPAHGYRIIEELNKRSQGYFEFSASTIYSALRRLERQGLVLSTWQQVTQKQKRRCYELTGKGRQILTEELNEWQQFYDAATEIVSPQKTAVTT